MNAIFKKLNFKNQSVIHVINAPESFVKEVGEMRAITAVKDVLPKQKPVQFLLAFVIKQKEVDDLAKKVQPLLEEGSVLWFAYPKGTSKRYRCEFNRDHGWQQLGAMGYEPVRMVSIDEDWSALRFKSADHIKQMTRSFATSEAGREKVAARSRGVK